MLAGLGFADTFMVSVKLGTTALAGVALVDRIDTFAKQFFLAFAQGGSVVLAQYMGINLGLKYIFIFKLDMGVIGATLSTLLAMGIIGFVLLIRLTFKKNLVRLEKPLKPEFDLKMSGRILKISLPNGFEQGMFQLGALILAGLVSSLGEDAINADQISRNLVTIVCGVSNGFCALMLMVIGRCMGAGDIAEAERYKKHILRLNHLFVFIMSIVFFIVLKPLVSVFGVSRQSEIWAIQITVFYVISSIFLYPPSFATASALRGAGDTKFVMFIAAGSMFLFRIGCAYLCVYLFDFGVISIWVAMVLDWVIRTVIFELRFKHGKWKTSKVILKIPTLVNNIDFLYYML